MRLPDLNLYFTLPRSKMSNTPVHLSVVINFRSSLWNNYQYVQTNMGGVVVKALRY